MHMPNVQFHEGKEKKSLLTQKDQSSQGQQSAFHVYIFPIGHQ